MIKLSMPLFEIDYSSDQFLIRKLRYFRFVYFLSVSMMVIYSIRYNFEFHTTLLNRTFFWTIALSLPAPLVYKKTKNILYYASMILFPISIGLMHLLWTSGGIDAPGIFWITAIPLSTAILLGTPWAIASVFVILGFLIASVVAKSMGINTNILGDLVDNATERNMNVFTFFFYSLATSIYFIQSENRFQKQINSQKNEINNLFKILIHDIATPLTAIDFRLTILIENQTTDNLPAIKKVAQTTKNLIALLNQVRALAALKDGKVDIKLKPIDLKSTLESVKDDLDSLLQQKSIILKTNYAHRTPYILGDQNILNQVVIRNLLTNAIKFSHENGVIDISTYQEDDDVRIEIRDYGVGIPEVLQDKIFSSHEDTSRKGTQGETGTGFGLPLVKEFTLKLGGQIEFQTSEKPLPNFPTGTLFRLKFKSTNQISASSNKTPEIKKAIS